MRGIGWGDGGVWIFSLVFEDGGTIVWGRRRIEGRFWCVLGLLFVRLLSGSFSVLYQIRNAKTNPCQASGAELIAPV